MANAFTDTGASAFGQGSIDWVSDTIRVALLDASFVPTYDTAQPQNITNADFFSDISSALVGLPVDLAGKALSAGTLQASDVTFPATSGNTVVRVAVYKWTGTAATSQVILMYDGNGTINIVPDGSDIVLHWDTGIITSVAGVAQI